MKLNSMVLSIDDRLPELTDFKRMIATGNSGFRKGTYLYVIEQELIADRYAESAHMGCVK